VGIPVQSKLIIKLLDGRDRYGILNQEFDPVSGYIDFFCIAEQRGNKLDLSEICFIKFFDKPELGDSFSEDEFFQDVTTLTGDRFHLRLKKSGKRFAQGFYGYPVEIDSDFKSIFFGSIHQTKVAKTVRFVTSPFHADLRWITEV
jgi:hypothetical protein